MGTEPELRWGTSSSLEVDGVGLHVEAAGDADAPGVLALHGFASGTFTWAGIAPDLAGDHRIVAWDRPPFGRSDRPRPTPGADPYSLDRQLAQLVAVVEASMSGEPDLVVGHSAGGLLALQAVVAGVIRPRRLVLLAPATRGGPPEVVRSVGRLPGAGAWGPAVLRLGLAGSAQAIRMTGRHRTALLDATARASGRALRRPGTAEALWHLTSTWQAPDLDGGLDGVDVATTVIGGDEDRIVPPVEVERLAVRLRATHHLLAGVGHAPHEQVPDQVITHIRGAL